MECRGEMLFLDNDWNWDVTKHMESVLVIVMIAFAKVVVEVGRTMKSGRTADIRVGMEVEVER